MKLLDECREKLCLFRYALRTERSYLGWIERSIRFCKTPDGFRHPRDLGAPGAVAFLTHLAGQPDVSPSTPIAKLVLRWLLGLLFIGAGANHFRVPDFYVRMMPPYLPWHRELVFVSGVCEIALGGLLLVPQTSRYAAWGLIALLVAVFPANLYMATDPERFPEFSPAALWGRLPVQALLIAWAYWFTGRD